MTDQNASDGFALVQTAVSFLDRVLPTSGWRVAYIVNGEKKFNAFYETNLQLAQALIRFDSTGAVAYHACSSFKENQRNNAQRHDVGRTQKNVRAVRSLWSDVDAGDGKPYPDAKSAAIATAMFCKAAQVPLPMVVGSGRGLHIYWPFADDIDPETWRVYAAGFAVLCHKYGFRVDRARTQDLSSVLRTPGTHHRKYGECLVTCSYIAGPFTLDQLEPFKNAGLSARVRNMAVPRERGLGSDLLGGMYDEKPSYADKVADECAQIRAIRESPDKVREPEYHAGIGVLHFCVDGRSRTLEWTDSRWHDAVNVKFERSQQLSGPTTCAHFHTINPDGCAGCRHSGHITTPLEMGRSREPDRHADRVAEGTGGTAGVEPEEKAINPPMDFTYAPDGALNLVIENKNGAESYELVCQHPIYLQSVQTGEQNVDNYSCLLRTKLPNCGWRSVVLPFRTVLGRDGIAEFAQNGVVIHHPDAWRKFVRTSIDRWYGKNMVEKRYDKFGWKDDDTTFLVGNRLYTSTGIVPVIGGEILNSRVPYFNFPRTRSASFERWQRAANKMFAVGLEHQSIAILAGFAAPLMRFHTAAEGGAILSFISDGSGTGKSTSLEAAASIWGALKGLQVDDSDTRIAKGLKLGMLNNLPCAYDDLYEHDPEVIRQFIMMFTNGTDKDRATTEGKLRDNIASWQTILLLASNKSMIDIISTHDTSDACATRILELTTDLPEGVARLDFEAVKRELAANHSFAGDRYMQTLVQPSTVNWIKENISGWTLQIRKAAGLEEHHRFWVRLAVSIIAAGTIVQKTGLLDFSVVRIRDWLIDTMRDQRDQIKGNRKGKDVISVLSSFVHDMRNDTLTVDKSYRPGGTVIVERPPTNKLLCRYETDSKRLLIAEIELRKWLNKKSINVKTFVKTLQEQGVIVGEIKKYTLGAGTNFASGQVFCFVVNMAHEDVAGVATPMLKVVR